jgi:aspartyl-tRNA(Asn)/glutamyl-tRNA(Gln) amidotransferase subunit A
VADAAVMLQALAQYDVRDPYSVRQEAEDFVATHAADQSTPRLGLMTDFIDRARPDVRAATEAAVKRLSDAGAEIIEAPFPVPADLIAAIHFLHTCTEVTAVHAEQYATMAGFYREDLAAKIEVGHLLPAPIYVHSSRLRRRCRTEMMRYAGRFDGLIGPVSPTVAPELSEGTGDPSFQLIFTLFGFPNISLPTWLGADGLPHAVQIACRPFEERNLLRLARWAEDFCEPLPSPI